MKPNRRIFRFVFFSILLHLFLIKIFQVTMEKWAQLPPEPPKPVWVSLKQESPSLPIADIAKPEIEEVPDKPSVESLYNQKVKEEMTADGSPPPKGTQNPAPQTQPQKPKPKEEAKETPKKPKPKKPNALSVEELYGRPTPAPSTSSPYGVPQGSYGNGSGDDFIPSFRHGGRTYVNALANPKIAYYVELKRRFRTAFNPLPVLRGASGNLIAQGQISVILGLTVDRTGRLLNVAVIRSSGLDRYDQEGIRTVTSSAPYSTPPANLLQEDGHLRMAWTFLVYM